MRTLLFGGLLAVSSEGLPYMVFFSVGMAAWMMLESSALWATRSLEVNRGVLRRIDVPRIVPLVSAVAPALLEFGDLPRPRDASRSSTTGSSTG